MSPETDVTISQNKWDPHTYHVAAANAKYKEDWKVRSPLAPCAAATCKGVGSPELPTR